MSSKARSAEVYNALNKVDSTGAVKGTVRILVTDKDGNDVGVVDLFEGYQIGRGSDPDSFLNKSLDGAKEIFSRLAAGDTNYKIAKIAFGNAGHNIQNPKQATTVTGQETELTSLQEIVARYVDGDSDNFFLRNENGTNRRMVYIEKDITPSDITFGQDHNQFIVRVPINYDDFNRRTGSDQTDESAGFVSNLISYTAFNGADKIVFGQIDTSTGGPETGADATEIVMLDDGNGGNIFRFKNGYNPATDSIDTTNGGIRPQEISEIMLLTDVVPAIPELNIPERKLAASKMTSGLLSFPEGFQFTYEWTLTWNFV